VLAFSGIRSDYDLLSGVYRALASDTGFEFGLIVYGAHLSPTSGRTVREVEQDGIPIVGRFTTLLDSDSRGARIKSAAILMMACIEAIESFSPDAIVYAGDREDALVAATVAAYLGIPGVHFFGGDHATDGNVDNAARHAISKLSSIHFVAAAEHRNRLLALGEENQRVYLVGSPSLDKFLNTPELGRDELFRALDVKPAERFAVVIHHPTIVDEAAACTEVSSILDGLLSKGITALVGYPNIYAGNRAVRETLEPYAHRGTAHVFGNVSRLLFVNLLRQATLLIGNSSAGMIEAPFIRLPVVNVGRRQRGRLHSDNVIFADGTLESVSAALSIALSREFQESLSTVQSPYGDGKSESKIVELLRRIEFDRFRFKTSDPLISPDCVDG
jgi:UDP-hydrolysing UDP-N-acetyl-D-glucosamine 2-epimerase